jgi:hypothetical protein
VRAALISWRATEVPTATCGFQQVRGESNYYCLTSRSG